MKQKKLIKRLGGDFHRPAAVYDNLHILSTGKPQYTSKQKSKMQKKRKTRKNVTVDFFLSHKHFSGLLQVQNHCTGSTGVITCMSNVFYNFRGVLQVYKHCSASVIFREDSKAGRGGALMNLIMNLAVLGKSENNEFMGHEKI